MGIMTRAVQKRADEGLDDGYYYDALKGGFLSFTRPTKTGIYIDDTKALQVAAVHNCVRLICETVASISLPVYRQLKPRGKERVKDHPLYPILHDRPNRNITSMEWREYMMKCVLLRGDGYSFIQRLSNGDIYSLIQLDPDKMKVQWGMRDGKNAQDKYYIYKNKPDDIHEYSSDRILQITGLGYNGLTSMSVLGFARESIGLAIATEEHGSNFFGSGAIPGGILQRPIDAPDLGDEGRENVEKSFYKAHGGLARSHRIAVLEEGMTYQQIGISNEDSQFLESRKFQVVDIARFFNIPVHMIKDLERATFSNIEHQAIEYIVYSIRPYLVRFEQRLKLSLFPDDPEYFAEFLIDALLRGDRKTRTEALKAEFMHGNINNDDWREIENRNPRPGGDKYYVPANLLEANASLPEKEPAIKSQRSKRGPASQTIPRMRLRQTYGRLIGQAAGRYVRREVNDLKRAVEKHLRKRSILSFEDYLEDFYKDHEEFIKREIGPVIRSYAEEVAALAADQVDFELGDKERELADFIEDYIAVIASRHVASSEGQLRSLIEKAAGDQEGLDNAISQRLDEWDERRPGKIERDEQIRANDAVASWIFVAAGFSLVWTTWGAKPCPYCLELSGKIIPAGGTFVKAGEVLNPDEEIEDMRVYGPKGHAPLHGGCVCTVEPA